MTPAFFHMRRASGPKEGPGHHGSGLDLDAIAAQVGYIDGATLRTLLRQRLGRGVRDLRGGLR
jgi:hypothetical protein